MKKIRIKGTWNILKGKLKQLIGSLTDNDLLFFDGYKEEVIGKLQLKIGKTKQKISDLSAKL
jgi:uncharacterized protein YjbJ (UPF0337 family)